MASHHFCAVIALNLNKCCVKVALKAFASEDTLLLVSVSVRHKPGTICCGYKMFLKEIRNIFVSRTQMLYHCCTRGQTRKHLCPQHSVLARLPSPQGLVWRFCTTLTYPKQSSIHTNDQTHKARQDTRFL